MVNSEESNVLPCLIDGKWAPDRTGNYADDCAKGRAEAELMLVYIDQTQNPAVFGTIARAIVVAGVYEAVEIGFCSRIGIQLCVPAA